MPKILLVDDEADMRFAARMVLERAGHTIVEANEGEAALKMLGNEKIDLVLLDMRLPGMDGIQILQKIRETNTELPVIMVTGYGNVELGQKAIELGADHYLSKPFHNKDLLEVVRATFEKRGISVEPVASASASSSEAVTEEIEESVETSSRRALRPALLGVLLIGLFAWGIRMSQNAREYKVPYSNPAGIVFIDDKLWVADWF